MSDDRFHHCLQLLLLSSSANNPTAQQQPFVIHTMAQDPRMPDPADGEKAEFTSMIRGGMYLASDPYIQKIAAQESAKVKAINVEQDEAKRMQLLRDFMGIAQDIDFYWIGPLFAEYVRGRMWIFSRRHACIRPATKAVHTHAQYYVPSMTIRRASTSKSERDPGSGLVQQSSTFAQAGHCQLTTLQTTVYRRP